jgi:PadR family transcriptional regulator, regulatory protein PadR
MTGPRMTLQVLHVLRALVDAGDSERYGLELMEETGLPSGTIYPIIARLEQAGWLASRREDPALYEKRKTPPRRYYRLTRDGAELAQSALARARQPRRRPWVLPAPGTQEARA